MVEKSCPSDQLTKRKESWVSTIHEDFVQDLNEYFGTLCVDDNYIKPVSVEIKDDTCMLPLLSTQVFNALSKIKKAATRPDGLPFWVWKENAAILTPVIKTIWNFSVIIYSEVAYCVEGS